MSDIDAKAALQSELIKAAREAKARGRRWDGRNRTLWWLGIAFAGAGIALGYIAGVLEAGPVARVEPWMVSALASAGAAIEVVRRRTGWEALGNAYWSKYVAIIQLVRDLHYGTDARKKSDPVRHGVKTLAEVEDRFEKARTSAMRDRQRSTAKDA